MVVIYFFANSCVCNAVFATNLRRDLNHFIALKTYFLPVLITFSLNFSSTSGLEYSILFDKTLQYSKVTSEDAPWMKAITACFWVNQTEGDTSFFVSYTSPVRPAAPAPEAPAPEMDVLPFKPIDLRSTFEVATAQYQLYFAINRLWHYTPMR